jgi:hypothetical protein
MVAGIDRGASVAPPGWYDRRLEVIALGFLSWKRRKKETERGAQTFLSFIFFMI